MVTAIVIPIICLYFYWVTRKEMKEHKELWLQLDYVTEESTLLGTIKEIRVEKQRFHYHYYVQVSELVLQTDHKEIRVKKISPLKKDMKPLTYKVGDYVRLFGSWKEGYFQINRVIVLKETVKDERLL